MTKRLISILIILMLAVSLIPSASATEYIQIDKVNLESYPNRSSGNNLPIVGQNISDFYCSTITSGIQVTGWSLIDDAGVQCTGKVENKSYYMNIFVSSNIVNYVFTTNTSAYINGKTATISPSADGLSATVTRYISPVIVDPVIYKNPGDENHDKSKPFSFTASASQYYKTYQWYILTPYGEKFTPEELSAAYPGVTTSVADIGNGAVRLNIGNPLDDMSGWLVYCTFTGESGAPVATQKAVMTIKGAAPSTPASQIVIVDAPGTSPTPTPRIVDGIEVPDGITIVDAPQDNIEIVTTPSPTPSSSPAPASAAPASDDAGSGNGGSSGTLLKVLKWVGIAIGAIVLIGGAVLFVQYSKDKKKRQYRSKMAGKTEKTAKSSKSGTYKGKH